VAAWLCLPWRSGEEKKNKEYTTSNRNEGEQDREKMRNTLLRSLLQRRTRVAVTLQALVARQGEEEAGGV
jgi:hypothetical protein